MKTIQELEKMTDEELRVMLAGLDDKCTHHPSEWERRGPDGDTGLYCNACQGWLNQVSPPNYPNDFKACHEVEEGLSEAQSNHYANFFWSNYTQFQAIHATARQRTIALILTLQPR